MGAGAAGAGLGRRRMAATAQGKGYFTGLSRNTFLLALASFFADVSTEMLYPVLPIFLTQTLGAAGSVVGLVEGVAEATQNIVQGFAGSVADRLQKRKGVALIGYAVAALSKPLIGLSFAWEGVLGARFLDRLGTGIRSAPRDALIAASAEDEHRGKAFGLEGAGDNAGAFVGPLIAVALLALWSANLRWIFYVAAVPGLLAFLMVLFVSERKVEAGAKASFGAALRRFPARYRRYLLATALFGVGNSSNAFLILQTKSLGASLSVTILIYAAFNLVAALVSYPAGLLSDRIGRRSLLLAAFGAFFIAYLGFALAQSTLVAAALFVLYGVFQGVFRAAGKALAGDLSPDDLRASGIGWYGAAVGLSGLAASGIAGLLWDHVGHPSVFLYGAAFAAVGALALVLLVPGRRAERQAG
jgi:MFS family permease